jgi:hypothetical protein
MLQAFKERVTIKRGGLVEIRRPELIEGTLADVIVVVDAAQGECCGSIEDLPIDHLGPWPADLPLRREDLYGDQGR